MACCPGRGRSTAWRGRQVLAGDHRAGRLPHLAAVWGSGSATPSTLSTGGGSRKARNLADDPRCAVTPEHADESVVVQGVASRVTDPAELSALLAAYRDKYGSGFPDPLQNPVVTVHPRVVFGVIEREEQFTTTATRWVFPS